MDKSQKASFVADLNTRVAKAQTMVVSHYRGLTVKQLQTLRGKLREQGGEAQVAKNRLAKLALKDTPFEGISDLLTGPTILTFSEDVVAAAKVTHTFAKENEALVILGGVMEGKVMDKAAVLQLAALPSLDELRGKLVGLLQAPAAQIARVLKAHADKNGAEAPAKQDEAPAAEAAAPAEAPVVEAAQAEAAPAAEAPATEQQSN
ncbi:MAG: 50S ribosomal protein L10 [Pseudomonadaceae bacterium]|nr:50S ribosomal protein L10 [Pseudomonadaceae bacterium]